MTATTDPKKIPAERWAEWCGAFTNGNCGRLISLEVVNDETSPKLLADNIAFVAIEYDPDSRGSSFLISCGNEKSPSEHVVAHPVGLWQGQDEDGLFITLEIDDERGNRTLMTLLAGNRQTKTKS